MVWVVWQLVWTSAWQLGAWQLGGAVRGRTVLPDVQYGNWWSRTDTNEAVELPRILILEKQTLDQQRDNTHRDRGRELGGDYAGKNQDTERSTESSFRGDQETSNRLGTGGRLDGQKQESCSITGESGGSDKFGPNRSGDMLKTTARCQTMAWTVASNIRTCQCSAGTLRRVRGFDTPIRCSRRGISCCLGVHQGIGWREGRCTRAVHFRRD